jgi:pimeloyl-ACP methyl ester carboxylesterase
MINIARNFSLLILFSFTALTGFGQTAGIDAGNHKAGDVVSKKRTAKTPEGEIVNYELGTFYVPENRLKPDSRVIGVGFARIKGDKSAGKFPVFQLPGGPGESNLSNFTASDIGSQRRLANLIKYYGSVGDIVVIDQRGFSDYGDKMMFSLPPAPLDKPRSLEWETALLRDAAKDAVAANPGKDLSGYTIVQCAEDVNDLRRALGYEKIILIGQSFGSQWSLAVMRLHPDTVARAQLSANEPLDNAYDMPSHIFASIQRIARDADRDPSLAPYLPKGGVIAAIREVTERLKKAPVKVTVDGKSVVLGLEDFREGLLMPAAEMPVFVLSLYHGHYDAWARQVVEARKDAASPQALIGPLIDTSIGVSPEREKLLRTDAGLDFLGTGAFETYINSADAWPTPDVGDDFRLPVASKIPVLFFHGDWDTSTPIENAFGMLPYFQNSRLVIVHRGSHGGRKEMLDRNPQILEAMVHFLRTGEFKDLPVEVELPEPKFQVPDFPILKK